MTSHSREYSLAAAADFPEGTHRVVEVNRRKIGMFNVAGQFYALPILCPQQLGPLCSGKVSGTLAASRESDWKFQCGQEGEIVTSPWHGLWFHIPTGQCLAFSEIRQRSYAVWVEGDYIKIRF